MAKLFGPASRGKVGKRSGAPVIILKSSSRRRDEFEALLKSPKRWYKNKEILPTKIQVFRNYGKMCLKLLIRVGSGKTRVDQLAKM